MARDYKKEYAKYHSKPSQIKRRAKRNAARAKMKRAGLVRKGDGKDVHHKKGVSGGNSRSNLGVRSKSSNRSFPRTKTGKVKRHPK